MLSFWGTLAVCGLVTKKPDGEPLKCRCPQRNMTAQMPSPDARIMDKLPRDHGQGEREGKKACI